MKRTITIADIAREAQVSIKTVSRALNNEPYVRDDTRTRVLRAAANLGYAPNISARQLAGKRSYVIAHFFDNPSLDYVSRIYDGVREACHKSGYYAIAERLRPLKSNYQKSIIQFLQRFAIDGAVLSPPLSDDRRLIKELQDRNIPCALLSPGEYHAGCAHVMVDDADAASKVAQLMLAGGHKKFAFVSGLKSHRASASREAGFRGHLEQQNISSADLVTVRGDFSLKSGFEAYEQVISQMPDVTAIFTANDDMAVGVIMAALKQGRTVPESLHVVGFDDSPFARTMWPSVTTVAQPVSLMAETATQQIIAEIMSGHASSEAIILPTQIKIRQSCFA